jgi:hypothetical protein
VAGGTWECTFCGTVNTLSRHEAGSQTASQHARGPPELQRAAVEYCLDPDLPTSAGGHHPAVLPHVVLVLDANLDPETLERLADSLPEALQVVLPANAASTGFGVDHAVCGRKARGCLLAATVRHRAFLPHRQACGQTRSSACWHVTRPLRCGLLQALMRPHTMLERGRMGPGGLRMAHARCFRTLCQAG